MQTPIIQQPDGKSYHMFFTGILANTPPKAEPRCATLLLKTKHFLVGPQYRSVVNANGIPQFVLKPNCNCPAGTTASSPPPSPWNCRLNAGANYAGLTAVFPAGDGKPGHLIGIYHCQTDTFKEDKQCYVKQGFFAQVCLARSQDGGKSWIPAKNPIIAGEPMPGYLDLHISGSTAAFVNGTPQPCAIQDQAHKYIYVYYPYVATGQYDPASGATCAPDDGCPKGQQGTFQVARATIRNGKIGPWKKSYLGRFDHPQQPDLDQPGLWGQGDSIVPDPPDEYEFARQPWVSYNTYLHAYVMTFICRMGWYFSLATDLETQNWTTPQKFYEAPCTLHNPDGSQPSSCGIFTEGNQTDENMVLITRGNPSNQITGQTGLVLYASTPAWGTKTAHTLYARKFTFTLYKENKSLH
jgi:hypothetical protein